MMNPLLCILINQIIFAAGFITVHLQAINIVVFLPSGMNLLIE